MNAISLYSGGCDGLSLAANWAGIETLAFCENDKGLSGIDSSTPSWQAHIFIRYGGKGKMITIIAIYAIMSICVILTAVRLIITIKTRISAPKKKQSLFVTLDALLFLITLIIYFVSWACYIFLDDISVLSVTIIIVIIVITGQSVTSYIGNMLVKYYPHMLVALTFPAGLEYHTKRQPIFIIFCFAISVVGLILTIILFYKRED